VDSVADDIPSHSICGTIEDDCDVTYKIKEAKQARKRARS